MSAQDTFGGILSQVFFQPTKTKKPGPPARLQCVSVEKNTFYCCQLYDSILHLKFQVFFNGLETARLFLLKKAGRQKGVKMSTKNTDEIHVRGIRSKGFGQLPKIVMLDPNIPLAAKGIYAHFVSYTGGGNNKAFPAVDTILHNLGVSSNTYYKYYNILLDLGLITVEQHNGGAAGKGFKKTFTRLNIILGIILTH